MRTSPARNGTCDAPGELRLAARPSQLGVAREYATRAAHAFGFDAERSHELVSAVNEAVTNAIRHGAPDEHGHISVIADADGDRLTVSVRDYGTFAGCPPNITALAESGRGFALMARLTDALQVCIGQGATTVRLSKTRT
jgi:anti-sigma regulatory factor (Ser/Thr protein kinase)